MDLYQASAFVMVGPGSTSCPAYLNEVKAALEADGRDTSELEQVDEGVFLIPLTEKEATELQTKKFLMVSLEIPSWARDTSVPKPEFASYVVFELEWSE